MNNQPRFYKWELLLILWVAYFLNQGDRQIYGAERWKPIRVGCRWENMGHPELNDRITWLRLRFRVPADVERAA